MISHFLTTLIGEAVFVGLAATVVAAVVLTVVAVTVVTLPATAVVVGAVAIGVVAGVAYGLANSGTGTGSGKEEANVAVNSAENDFFEEIQDKPDELLNNIPVKKYRLVIRAKDVESKPQVEPFRFQLFSFANGKSDSELLQDSNIMESSIESFQSAFGTAFEGWLDKCVEKTPESSDNYFEVFLVKPFPGTEVAKRIENVVRNKIEERKTSISFGIVSENSPYLKLGEVQK